MVAVYAEDLAEYIGDPAVAGSPVLDEATAMLETAIGDVDVPDAVRDNATLQLGAELWNRRSAPFGVSSPFGADGPVYRAARDPMASVWPLLRLSGVLPL